MPTRQSLFQLLDLNPKESRSEYDDDAALEALRRNPSAATTKFRCTNWYGRTIHPFFMAVALGASMKVVRLLYDTFPDAIKEKDSCTGQTPLHCAIIFHAPFEVLLFLTAKYPAALESTDISGCTPLHHACECGAPAKVVGLLMEGYPDAIDIEDKSFNTPLIYSQLRNKGYWEVLTLLTTLDTLLRTNPSDDLVLALLHRWRGEMWNSQVAPILHCRSSVVEKLDISKTVMPTLLDRVGREGRVQTMFRIVRDNMGLFHRNPSSILTLSCMHKSQQSHRNQKRTSKFWAPMSCSGAMAQTPYALNAHPHLATAAMPAKKSLFQLLDLNPCTSRTEYDDNAVLEAIHRNPYAATTMFRCTNWYGNTIHPFFMAVVLGASMKVVSLLYEAFPDAIKDKDRSGRTPLHCAILFRAAFEVLLFLAVKYPTAIESTDISGRTPLHQARDCGTPVDVELMLVQKLEVDRTLMPSLLGKVGREDSVQIMFLFVSENMGLFCGLLQSKQAK